MPAVPAARESMLIVSGVCGATARIAVATLVLSTTLRAVTTTRVGDESIGAVNTPLSRIVPAVADQVTAVFFVFDSVATNCCEAPEWRVAEEGEMLKVLTFGTWSWTEPVPCDDEMPVHPTGTYARANRRTAS